MHGDDPDGIPLIPLVPREAWTQEVRDFFAISEGEQCRTEGTRFNVQKMMANHLPLTSAWCTYNRFIAKELELDNRLREIAILRIAYLVDAGYEWHQHRAIGKRCGLTDAELAAVSEGEGAVIWSEDDRLVLRTADQMHGQNAASSETIAALVERFGQKQMMELLWTIGTYGMLGWIINSLGVPIEDFMLG